MSNTEQEQPAPLPYPGKIIPKTRRAAIGEIGALLAFAGLAWWGAEEKIKRARFEGIVTAAARDLLKDQERESFIYKAMNSPLERRSFFADPALYLGLFAIPVQLLRMWSNRALTEDELRKIEEKQCFEAERAERLETERKRLEELRTRPGFWPDEETKEPFTPTPIEFTAEEEEKIRAAFLIKTAEDLARQKMYIVNLSQTFERYLLHGLKVQPGDQVAFYSLGCGTEGAVDAFAMKLAAGKQDIKVKTIGVDLNSVLYGRPLGQSKDAWQRLVVEGLMDGSDALFIQGDFEDINFTEIGPGNKALLVALRNFDPRTADASFLPSDAPLSSLGRLGNVLLPIMQQYHDQGLDSRLLLTAASFGDLGMAASCGFGIRSGALSRAAIGIKSRGIPLSLKLLHDNKRNPTRTPGAWGDNYVSVIGF